MSFVLVVGTYRVLRKLSFDTPSGYCLGVVWQLLSLAHTDDPGLLWSSSVRHEMG